MGAGSSGAALAALLAKGTSETVLLLEAGSDYRTSETPAEVRQANSLVLLEPGRFDHLWWKPPVRYTPALAPTPLVRGKVIGGCSAVNCQVAIRGVLEDYDLWAADGCDGWSGRDVLASFIRLENDLDFGSAPFHGGSGPLPIQRPGRDAFGPADNVLADAAVDLGYGWADDHNAPGATGASPAAMNSRNGVRFSTNDAYLEPARTLSNLSVVGDALVDRVLFDGRTATGVRCRKGDGWTVYEARETIICAGTIYSPAILMRSGVGPAPQLQALGIPVIHDSPGVGANLSDHPSLFLNLVFRERGIADTADRYPLNCLVRFTSGLAGTGINDMGFGSFNLWGSEEDGHGQGLIFVTLFQAYSRGVLTLSSSDPEADPDVQFNMLSDSRDLTRMREGVRRLLEIGAHPAAAKTVDSMHIGEHVRSLDDLSSLSKLDEWLLQQVDTIGHPCGTCRMGSRDDPRSVVDADCQVIGVEGLRVADASVMPAVPRANNHLSCVMLAEHLAARMIRPGAITPTSKVFGTQ